MWRRCQCWPKLPRRAGTAEISIPATGSEKCEWHHDQADDVVDEKGREQAGDKDDGGEQVVRFQTCDDLFGYPLEKACQVIEDAAVQLPRTVLVGVGKGGTLGRIGQSQVAQLAFARSQPRRKSRATTAPVPDGRTAWLRTVPNN
jgi:hypothetical protein